jgi:hypothetical protein
VDNSDILALMCPPHPALIDHCAQLILGEPAHLGRLKLQLRKVRREIERREMHASRMYAAERRIELLRRLLNR